MKQLPGRCKEDGPGKRAGTAASRVLIASRKLHLALIALSPNPNSCRESAPHTLSLSLVVLSLLIHPSREIKELCGPSRTDPRFFQTGRLAAGGQGMELKVTLRGYVLPRKPTA